MMMKLNRVNKITFFMILIFFITIPILYLVSDTRIEILREIYFDSEIFLPKGTEYLGDINKGPSFHGDGTALRLVRIREEDEKNVISSVEKVMKKIDRNSDEFSNMESSYNERAKENYEIENFDFYSKDCIYFYNALNQWGGNFRAVVYNPKNNKFLLIVMDS